MAEKEYWQYSLSVSKALNSSEAPLKIKHARFVIISTHHHKECNTLWKLLSAQPIMENRFAAWKFCHLLHKVLREGHSSAILQSQSHKKMLIEMGNMWGHLEDLGTCIQAYSKLLVKKLDFHYKNSFFPGSFAVSIEDFERHSGNDINIYFQLCVEMFDFLEEILNLQKCVFHSVNTYRMFSMSLSAQCRLAPLITLIQDSNPLYDFCVRVMFKLHDNLQADILGGHRQRFKEIFLRLKQFYDKVGPLQYFENLIQVPHLPETAPNFSSKIDFGNYIPPVIKVPEIEFKSDLENLVDLSAPSVLEESTGNIENRQLLLEKDLEIAKMKSEIFTIREKYNANKEEYQTEINELTKEVTILRKELLLANELNANVTKKMSKTPELIQKNVELEENLKDLDGKFNKFKAMYSQIREEHINLLRQNGELSKILSSQKKVTVELTSENESFKKQVTDLLVQNEMRDGEKKDLEHRFQTLLMEVDQHKKKQIELQKEVEDLKAYEKTYSNKISLTKDELTQKMQHLNQTSEQVQLLKNELKVFKDDAIEHAKQHDDVINKIKTDLYTKTLELEKLKETHTQEQKEAYIKHHQTFKELEEVNESLIKKELEFKQLSQKYEKEKHDLNELITKLNDQALRDKTEATLEKVNNKNISEQFVKFLLNNFVSSVNSTFNNVQQSSNSYTEILDKITKNLDTLYDIHNKKYMCEETINCFFDSILSFLLFLILLQGVCGFTNRTVADVKNGEKLWSIIQSLKSPINKLFLSIQFEDSYILIENINEIKIKLLELKCVLQDISQNLDANLDLADKMKRELSEMERTIAEATNKFLEMLTHTKSKDDGIKLKVNEKILDACTNLMECIKQLIKKSKALQDEIVHSGRGNVSLKEFYNRNSEWTEGLISAAKSIARGANFLVEAANNAVVEDSHNNMEIIVAAQEIAACTAQLVIASKVKAHKDSLLLQELTLTSKSVSQATGAVVAIVKDCVEDIERYNEIDVLKLTSSQAKAAEMNIQVKVLELEQALQSERQKLAAFRKNLYKNCDN